MIEYSGQQETEIDTGLISGLQNHSTNVPAETQTDFQCDFDRTEKPEVTEQVAVGDSVYAKDTCADRQGTTSEQDSHHMSEKGTKENPAKESSCDESGTDIQTRTVYCEPGTGLDVVAVIDYDPDTGTPVYVVDVDVSPIFWYDSLDPEQNLID